MNKCSCISCKCRYYSTKWVTAKWVHDINQVTEYHQILLALMKLSAPWILISKQGKQMSVLAFFVISLASFTPLSLPNFSKLQFTLPSLTASPSSQDIAQSQQNSCFMYNMMMTQVLTFQISISKVPDKRRKWFSFRGK